MSITKIHAFKILPLLFLAPIVNSYANEPSMTPTASASCTGAPTTIAISAPPLTMDEYYKTGIEKLHHFQYDHAAVHFQAMIDGSRHAQDLARGYWGLLMTFDHPLWDEQNCAAARDALQRYKATGSEASDPRDKGLIDAVQRLYVGGSKHERNTAYRLAMAELYKNYSSDDDIASLYGLALLGESKSTVNKEESLNLRKNAADVFKILDARSPDHPGMLHYFIHSYDDARRSPAQALQQAARYTKVGTNAPHALHMPSHIYLPLGMWKEVDAGNTTAWAQGKAASGNGTKTPFYDIHALHALHWLSYAQLQQGKFPEAKRSLKEMEAVYLTDKKNEMYKWYLSMMYATYLTDTPEDADTAIFVGNAKNLALNAKDIELQAVASLQYAIAWHALQRMRQPIEHAGIDFDTATEAIREIERLVTGTEDRLRLIGKIGASQPSYFTGAYEAAIKPARIMALQLTGMMARKETSKYIGYKIIKEAAALEKKLPPSYGPPTPAVSSFELLGEYYLEDDRVEEAKTAFSSVSPGLSQRRRNPLAKSPQSAQAYSQQDVLQQATIDVDG